MTEETINSGPAREGTSLAATAASAGRRGWRGFNGSVDPWWILVTVIFLLIAPLLTSIIMRTFGWRVIFAGMLFAMLISIDNLPISFFFGSVDINTLPVVMLSYLEHQFDPSVAAASTIQLIVAVIGLFIVERIYGLDAMTPAT